MKAVLYCAVPKLRHTDHGRSYRLAKELPRVWEDDEDGLYAELALYDYGTLAINHRYTIIIMDLIC